MQQEHVGAHKVREATAPLVESLAAAALAAAVHDGHE
jgi:hypothetical protein